MAGCCFVVEPMVGGVGVDVVFWRRIDNIQLVESGHTLRECLPKLRREVRVSDKVGLDEPTKDSKRVLVLLLVLLLVLVLELVLVLVLALEL